jgi:hypothetical protein
VDGGLGTPEITTSSGEDVTLVSSSSALVDFLASGAPFYGADLYAFTLVDGTSFRCTSFDRSITYGGQVYSAFGPYIQRSKIKLAVGLVSSAVEIDIIADPGFQVESTPILVAIAQGRFAAAGITIRRAFMPTPGDTNLGGLGDGTIVRFAGSVGAVTEVGPLNAKLEGRGIVYQLNRPLPKILYQPGCWHSLFDAGCALAAGSFTHTGSVFAGSSTTVVNTGLTNDVGIAIAPASACTLSDTAGGNLPAATYYVQATYVTALGETIAGPESNRAVAAGRLLTVGSPPAVTGALAWRVYIGLGSGDEEKQNAADIAIGTGFTLSTNGAGQSGIIPPDFPTNGYWAQGVITFTSGVLIGQSAYIIASNPAGAVSLEVPLPAAPATGDTYSIIPGCDKSFATCGSKFSNTANFSGFPYTPTPEAGI